MTKEAFLGAGAFLAALWLLWKFVVSLKGTLESLENGMNLLEGIYEGVKKLMTKVGAFMNGVWVVLGFATFTEKRMEETVVGLKLMLGEVRRCIKNPNSRIIGLYGLGGVGKTTLLKEINNELGRRRLGFKHVIWVSVSEPPDLENIQEEILRQLQIPDGAWQPLNKDDKANKIYNKLKNKRFVLLLDLDKTRERLDLVEVGVPNHAQAKVVFTARTLELCGQMRAKEKIKVCLPQEAALDLLWTKAGNRDRTLSIYEHAITMAAECQGLSLALHTAGHEMANRDTPGEWEYSISILRDSPSNFSDMDVVISLLKFNLDGLKVNRDKSCFWNCCSKFVADRATPLVRKQELIDLWIEKELVTVQNHGEFIIGSLKKACLLEDIGESGVYVTMHPLIRGMGLELERSHAQG